MRMDKKSLVQDYSGISNSHQVSSYMASTGHMSAKSFKDDLNISTGEIVENKAADEIIEVKKE